MASNFQTLEESPPRKKPTATGGGGGGSVRRLVMPETPRRPATARPIVMQHPPFELPHSAAPSGPLLGPISKRVRSSATSSPRLPLVHFAQLYPLPQLQPQFLSLPSMFPSSGGGGGGLSDTKVKSESETGVIEAILRNWENQEKSRLGSGSYGQVYGLTVPNVAVKVVPRATPQELMAWARITEQCGIAQNTLPLLSAWRDENTNTTYYISPRCDGTLKDSIDFFTSRPSSTTSISSSSSSSSSSSLGKLNQLSSTNIIGTGESESDYRVKLATQLRHVLPDLVTALGCIHGTRLYHRDIKPENIYLCNGKWTLADYGISIDEKKYADAIAGRNGSAGGISDIGGSGAGAYLAKWDIYETEENKGLPPPGFNYRSDIYSLGVVMQNILNFILLNRDEYATLYALIVRMLDPDYRNRPQLMEIQTLLE